MIFEKQKIMNFLENKNLEKLTKIANTDDCLWGVTIARTPDKKQVQLKTIKPNSSLGLLTTFSDGTHTPIDIKREIKLFENNDEIENIKNAKIYSVCSDYQINNYAKTKFMSSVIVPSKEDLKYIFESYKKAKGG